jgi:hypothetical protein
MLQGTVFVAFLIQISCCTCHALAVDGFNVVALKPGTVTELLLTDSEGQQLRTFADKEGWFALHDVNPGTYVLTTYNPMFVYPEVGDSMQQQQQLKLGLMHTLHKLQHRSVLKVEKHALHVEKHTLLVYIQQQHMRPVC